jgi:cystinosin
MNDWSGITGNPAKMALSVVTISFDVIFLVQHYILYPDAEEKNSYSTLPTK